MTPAAAFYQDIWVLVHEGVYEPAEDTFMLCDNLDITPGEHVLEIGTGCGLVAVVAGKAGARVVATDQSELAVQNALENITHHRLQTKIEVRRGNLFEPIRSEERFSLIVFNPPYLPSTKADAAYDPAWSGGKAGREITELFLSKCTHHLTPEGRLLLLQSSVSNPEKTQNALEKQFSTVRVKAKKALFFERLLLHEALNPIK